MRLGNFSKILATLLLGSTLAMANTTAELHSLDGNAGKEIKTFTTHIKKIGFGTVSNNVNIQDFYLKKFKEKNVELLSFFTVTNIEKMRELLLHNPDFGAYAPFNFLEYKNLDENVTWYGHLDSELMLNIIGEKDEAYRKKFKDMVQSFDDFATKELKPKGEKKIEYTGKLPEKRLFKAVKTFKTDEDLEDFVSDFIVKHDGLFVKHKFIIAGFLDFKFEYDDSDSKFDKYDAYWVSSLCHFEFSNSVFNHGHPEAGVFAPCSVYFYIPKGKQEIHVGYATVDNWAATSGIKDKAKIEYMKKIDAEVGEVFKELGFKVQ